MVVWLWKKQLCLFQWRRCLFLEPTITEQWGKSFLLKKTMEPLTGFWYWFYWMITSQMCQPLHQAVPHDDLFQIYWDKSSICNDIVQKIIDEMCSLFSEFGSWYHSDVGRVVWGGFSNGYEGQIYGGGNGTGP